MRRYFTIWCLCVFVLSQSQGQQLKGNDFENMMTQVSSLIGQAQLDEALKLLDNMKSQYQDSSRVWGALGFVYNQKGEKDKSIESYQEAIKLDPNNGRALFSLGLAMIDKDELEEGFDYLIKAKATNQVNTTNIQVTPIFSKIKDDKRLAELFPSKKELRDAFVEETKVVYEIQGEAMGDQFGWIARNIGDVDKDGIDDWVTSAPTNDEGGNNAGKIYVYSGKSGKLIWSVVGAVPNGRLGLGVEFGGDIDNDGTPDVVAAAPFDNSAYAYSGIDGTQIHRFKGDSNGGFGMHLSGVGDVNGDGYSDILVGQPYQYFNAPVNADSITHPGKAHLFSGKDGSELIVWEGEELDDAFGSAVAGRVLDGEAFLMVGAPNAGANNGGRTYVYRGIDKNPEFVVEADSTGSRLGGMFLSVIGDMNKDGVVDLYISDWSNNAKGSSTGRAYIHSGKDGSNLYTWTGETPGEGFGIGVSDCGDVNDDGYADAAIGSWQYSGAAAGGGKVRLHSGKDGSLIRSWTCQTMGDTFGFDTTGLGDVDGDGTIDLLITSAWSAAKGFRSGRIFVIRGL